MVGDHIKLDTKVGMCFVFPMFFSTYFFLFIPLLITPQIHRGITATRVEGHSKMVPSVYLDFHAWTTWQTCDRRQNRCRRLIQTLVPKLFEVKLSSRFGFSESFTFEKCTAYFTSIFLFLFLCCLLFYNGTLRNKNISMNVIFF